MKQLREESLLIYICLQISLNKSGLQRRQKTVSLWTLISFFFFLYFFSLKSIKRIIFRFSFQRIHFHFNDTYFNIFIIFNLCIKALSTLTFEYFNLGFKESRINLIRSFIHLQVLQKTYILQMKASLVSKSCFRLGDLGYLCKKINVNFWQNSGQSFQFQFIV